MLSNTIFLFERLFFFSSGPNIFVPENINAERWRFIHDCRVSWNWVNLFKTKGESGRRSSRTLEDTRRVCKILSFNLTKEYYSETKISGRGYK